MNTIVQLVFKHCLRRLRPTNENINVTKYKMPSSRERIGKTQFLPLKVLIFQIWNISSPKRQHY